MNQFLIKKTPMAPKRYGDPEEKERTEKFRKNEKEETFLEILNNYLVPFEEALVEGADSPRLPVTFIIGTPRSGTTLLMQLAVSSYELGYPSNLMARFFKVPAVGAWIQRIVVGKNRVARSAYESTFGVTSFPEEPHEFGYFWTSFFRPGTTHWFEPEELEKVKKENLLQKLSAIETILDRPLIFKSLNLDFIVEYLGNILPKPFFVYVKRDLYFSAESIYIARIRRYGSADVWWSLRPKQYPLLKKMDPFHQVAGQVWAIKTELERQLSTVPEAQKLELDYKAVCENPARELGKYAAKMQALGCPLNSRFEPPGKLACKDVVKLDRQKADQLRKALEVMENFTNW